MSADVQRCQVRDQAKARGAEHSTEAARKADESFMLGELEGREVQGWGKGKGGAGDRTRVGRKINPSLRSSPSRT